jgi:hypothetical protein
LGARTPVVTMSRFPSVAAPEHVRLT